MDRLATLRRHQQELAAASGEGAASASANEPAASPSCPSSQATSAPPAIGASHVEEMNMLIFNANTEISKLEIAIDAAFLPLHGLRNNSGSSSSSSGAAAAATAGEEDKAKAQEATPTSDMENSHSISTNETSARPRPPPISMPVTPGALAEIDDMLLSLQFALTRCKTLRDGYDAETEQLRLLARMDPADAGVVDGHTRRPAAAGAAAATSAELHMRCNISTYICERLKATLQRLWTVEERYHAARVEAARRQLTIYFMKGHTGSGGDGTPDASTKEGRAVLQRLKQFNRTRVEVDHLGDVLVSSRKGTDLLYADSNAVEGVGSDDFSEMEEVSPAVLPPQKAKGKKSSNGGAAAAAAAAVAAAEKKKRAAVIASRMSGGYDSGAAATAASATEDAAATQQVLIASLAEYIVNTRQDLQDGQGGIFCFTSCEQLYNSIMDNRMAIAEVEQNMEKLHRLFLDLHFCVMEQEDDIMKILKNTQATHEQTKRGRLEIKRGKKYYNRCGLCCTIM